jgi:hypothetical protein
MGRVLEVMFKTVESSTRGAAKAVCTSQNRRGVVERYVPKPF